MYNFPEFSGSYLPDDVRFLLKPVSLDMTPVELKEQLIQSGKKHYSDMLSQEPEPTTWHLDLFNRALEKGAPRLARDVAFLTQALSNHFAEQPIVLVSLVRAGVPLGVMLHQALRDAGKISHHYGISIIRDRGIDTAALEWIEHHHGTAGIVFVDGWTGKGAITGELIRSLHNRPGYPADPRLVVLADPAGCAWLSAADDDWLIPSGIMGAPVSGHISRSVWSDNGPHGCVHCEHLQQYECSRLLTDTVAALRRKLTGTPVVTLPDPHEKSVLRAKSKTVINTLAARYEVSDLNRLKPGIAEATRAVLRRVPEHVLVRDCTEPDVELLVYLARQKNITITQAGDALGQYRAVTIIKKVSP